jgi:hypothetical protein
MASSRATGCSSACCRGFKNGQPKIGLWAPQPRPIAGAKVTLLAETKVPDAELEAAAAAFSEKDLGDLTLAIGLINLYNRNNVSLRRPPAFPDKTEGEVRPNRAGSPAGTERPAWAFLQARVIETDGRHRIARD